MEAKKPDSLTDQHVRYLNDLHSTGPHNMWDAVQHIERVFSAPRNEAQEIVAYWMETFSPEIIH